MLYKIRRRSDGLFSTGGWPPDFTERGKNWTHIGHLKAHLRGVGRNTYHNCEIVEYEVRMIEKTPISIEEILSVMAEQDAREAAEERRQRIEAEESRERAELDRLRQKYKV